MARYGPPVALIVVDLQNDFADPAGGLAVPGGDRIIGAVNREIRQASTHEALVVATQDWHPEHTPHFARDGGPWPVHCVAGTWGAELHPALTLPAGAPRIRKGANGEDGYSGFTMRDPDSGRTIATELETLLRDAAVERVVIVGLATDHCVKATALDAARLGFATTVLPDAVAAVDLEPGDGDRAIAAMRAAGVEIGPTAGRPDRGAARAQAMKIHVVDATYELFRAHFAPRPPVVGRDGIVLSGVSGLVEQLLYLLRDEGATHLGCATDRVIESFRNDLYPGYKSSAGMPPELLAQFPIAEAAVEALGIVLWPMVEFEADDAIAAATLRFAADPRVERILICTPDKDMAQLVQDDRIVLWDRRRGLVYDDAGVRAKWGVAPASIPDYLAVVGDASDGYPGLPGWGSKSAAAILSRYGHLEAVPAHASAWEVPGVGGSRAVTLAAALREHWTEAMLYRDLARLRTADDGVQIRQHDPDELRWEGAPRSEWEAFCEEWGLDRLRRRPHRWRDD